MQDFIDVYQNPKLNKPALVAAWPGMGRVAMLAVDYLRNKLDAQLLAEVKPSDYFAPTGAQVYKKLIRPPEPPKNRLYYYTTSSSTSDLLIFIGSAQPIPHKEYQFAKTLLEITKQYHTEMVYTAAAAPSDMHFKSEPRVFAVPNDAGILRKTMIQKAHHMGEGNIAGMNGLLISVAAEMQMGGICLLGEIPFFTAQVEFPRASIAVLNVLLNFLDLEIDLSDLELYASKKDKEIEPLAALLSKEERKAADSRDEEAFIPKEEERIPKTVRTRIEKLFKQAEFDRSYKSKMRLKEELDKWELFDEYLDRFLDLFQKPQGES